MAPVSGPFISRQLFIRDPTSGTRFLVDTGAEVSVLPPVAADRCRAAGALELQAANGTPIATYGQRLVTVNLGLRRSFPWVFLVANVQHTILGADFLQHFNLQVDLRRKRLVDTITQLSVDATVKSRHNAHHRANAHPPFQRQKSCKGVIFPLVIAQSV